MRNDNPNERRLKMATAEFPRRLKHFPDTTIIVNDLLANENNISYGYGIKVIFEYGPSSPLKRILHKCSCGIIFKSGSQLNRHIKWYERRNNE